MNKEEARGLHKRLYRIYYTAYDEDAHRRVIELLSSKYGVTPKEIRSSVAPEYRFIELPLDKDGLVDEIKSLVSDIVKSQYVKVDWIDTSR